mmetsp:Transcript_13784/g.16411  ORF Transcript_13784/g.16411 Transcript_13784/m.16411 type:complete len:231 (-) Transcript_13784:53-745(-)
MAADNKNEKIGPGTMVKIFGLKSKVGCKLNLHYGIVQSMEEEDRFQVKMIPYIDSSKFHRIKPENMIKVCHKCQKESDMKGRCGGCHGPAYCSKKCAKDDWKNHKIICKEFQKTGKLPIGYTMSERPPMSPQKAAECHNSLHKPLPETDMFKNMPPALKGIINNAIPEGMFSPEREGTGMTDEERAKVMASMRGGFRNMFETTIKSEIEESLAKSKVMESDQDKNPLERK